MNKKPDYPEGPPNEFFKEDDIGSSKKPYWSFEEWVTMILAGLGASTLMALIAQGIIYLLK